MNTSFLCPLKVCFCSVSLTEWSCVFLFHHILFVDWWATDPEDLHVSGGSDEKRSFLRSQCFSLNSFTFAFDIRQEGNVCRGCLVSVHRFHRWRVPTCLLFSQFTELQKSEVQVSPCIPFPPAPPHGPRLATRAQRSPNQDPHLPSLPHMMDEGMAPAACTSLGPVGEGKGQTWGEGFFGKG